MAALQSPAVWGRQQIVPDLRSTCTESSVAKVVLHPMDKLTRCKHISVPISIQFLRHSFKVNDVCCQKYSIYKRPNKSLSANKSQKNQPRFLAAFSSAAFFAAASSAASLSLFPKDNNFKVVYRVPVTSTRSRGIVHRQLLWLADMWHAY